MANGQKLKKLRENKLSGARLNSGSTFLCEKALINVIIIMKCCVREGEEMKKKVLSIILTIVLVAILAPISIGTTTKGEDTEKKPDPNFHIYLAFGQDNMEGQGTINKQDRSEDSRYKMLCTSDFVPYQRKVGEWYNALPPLSNMYGKLGVADYFGRELVEKLDARIKVGIVNVSAIDASIYHFRSNVPEAVMQYSTSDNLRLRLDNCYGGNLYDRLIEMGKKAQEDGVIKGIIMHQGETDAGDGQWPNRVKDVYNNIINDLNLGDDIPLLAGETNRYSPAKGANNNIAKLPRMSRNFFVVSSEGLDSQSYGNAFSPEDYRSFGKRYAETMMTILGDELNPVEPTTVQPTTVQPTTDSTTLVQPTSAKSTTVKPTKKAKKVNTLSLKGKKVKVKYKKLRKKAQRIIAKKSIKYIDKGQGKLTYKLVKVKKAKFKKYFKINKKTGKLTIKKRLKKGTYKVIIKIKAAGNEDYKVSAWKKVTVKVKVK